MNLKSLSSYANFYGCFILCGDTYLSSCAVNFVKQKMNITNSFDISIFDSENFSSGAIIESCEQVSFFTTNKLVIVKNVFQVLESDKKKLLEYIPKMNPTCTLLILDNLQVFDFLKCTKLNFTLTDFELVQEMQKLAKEKGKAISNEDALYLTNLVGKDLTLLNTELDKLSMYTTNDSITKQDIDSVVTKTDDVVVFELTTALGKKDANKSLSILFNLLKQGSELSKLLPLMSNNFTRLFTMSVSKNMTDELLAQKLGIKPFAVTKLRGQLKNFNPVKLKNIVYEFCDVDYMIKSGLMQADTALVYIVEYILNI